VPGEGGWAVAVTADRSDVLGCLVWEMTVRRTTPPAEGASLRAWGERIAARVTGLLEPLKLVEVDVQRNEALLRSDGPTQRGDNVVYYEAILQGTNAAVVRRYQGSRQGNTRREQVPFAITHEALAKLTADLTAEK